MIRDPSPLELSSHVRLLTSTTILKKSEETEMKRKTRRRSSCVEVAEKKCKKRERWVIKVLNWSLDLPQGLVNTASTGF
jgi:hypothetical protein